MEQPNFKSVNDRTELLASFDDKRDVGRWRVNLKYIVSIPEEGVEEDDGLTIPDFRKFRNSNKTS